MTKLFGGYVWSIESDPNFVQSWKTEIKGKTAYVQLEYCDPHVNWAGVIKEGTVTEIEFHNLTSFEIAAQCCIDSVNRS
jgi:hypothetical protein